MGKGIIIVISIVAVAVILGVVFAISAWNEYNNDIKWQTCCRDFFELSDSATTPEKKIYYMDKYLEGLRSEGLDKGVNSVFNSDRPYANNAFIYSLATDIRTKLVKWNATDPVTSPAGYKLLQDDITWQDYCWYPRHAMHQAFQLKQGGWGAALWPPEQYDFCKGERPTDSSLKVTTTSK